MATLLQMSEARAQLPEFQGASLTERLTAGATEARARLLKYTATTRYQEGSADDLLHEINAWKLRNQAIIEQRMADPAIDSLPEQIALELGPEKAQQYIVAGYSMAAAGLGPWIGGDLVANMATDPSIPEPWVREDAALRLNVFASIVKLDDDGDLERIFRPDNFARAPESLGALPALVTAVGARWVVTALLLFILGTVAVFLVYSYSMEKLRLNNKILAERCAAAEATGNQELIKACIEATKEAQQDPLGGFFAQLMKIAVVGGLVYAGVAVGMPLLAEAIKKKPKAKGSTA